MTPEEIAEGRRLLKEANRNVFNPNHRINTATREEYHRWLTCRWLTCNAPALLAAAEECLRLREEIAALKAELTGTQFIDDMEGG